MILVLIAFIFLTQGIQAQQETFAVLSGSIKDVQSGEVLSGATIWIPDLKNGTSSNRYGYYALKVPKGRCNIEISFVGYNQYSQTIEISRDTVLNWSLKPGLEISEIHILSDRRNFITLNAVLPGVYYLNPAKIELSPAILGEPDALKFIQMLPGVHSGNEGTSGIQVRGGSHDQNLILLDGIPVYNTNHLFGYFSTFNTDAIKDIRFYKGGIPARFGGRLSSVVDVFMKEGNMNKTGGEFSVSPVAGHFTLEGPLKKETTSFMVAGRRSWLDIPLQAGQLLSGTNEQFGYSFYDLNVKLNWMIDPGNRIFFSHYQGKDGYFLNIRDSLFRDSYRFNWGNHTTMVRWNHLLSHRLFVNTSAYYSHYAFREIYEVFKKRKTTQHTSSGLEELSLKSDFDWSLTNHAIKFGFQISRQGYRPEMNLFTGLATDTTFQPASPTLSLSCSFYGEDECRISDRFMMNAGVRALVYAVGGTLFFFPEPRIFARHSLSETSDLKFSLQKMVQPVHLLTNNALNMPTDLWVSSTGKTKPAEAWIFDLGYGFHPGTGWNMEADAYIKPMKNLVEYKPGVILFTNQGRKWEDLVETGRGLNWGLELMFEKNSGKLTGWAGYTLSWAKRKFPDINNGEYFPFKFDRRHNLTLLANYVLREKAGKKRLLSGTFVFTSGNAVTIPDEHVQGIILPGLSSDFSYIDHFSWYESFPHPNNYRMPPFHHLDLAWSATKKLKKDRERTWKFSVYNVYNRLNPYFYYKRYDHYLQVSMLPVIPSVTYSLKF